MAQDFTAIGSNGNTLHLQLHFDEMFEILLLFFGKTTRKGGGLSHCKKKKKTYFCKYQKFQQGLTFIQSLS